MKITISYIPEEARLAADALELLRQLLPEAKVRSGISYPPFKHLYLATKKPARPCKSEEDA